MRARTTAWILVAVSASTSFLACGDTVTPVGDTDAASPAPIGTTPPPTPTGTSASPVPKDAQPDSPVPADASLPDAAPADAAAPVDGSSTDGSSTDAADSATTACGATGGRLCNLGETCAADPDCGASNVCEANVCAASPPVRTVTDIPGLTHFDFDGANLIYTVTAAPTKVNACTLPRCADGAEVPNITMVTAANRYFAPSVARVAA